MTLTDFLHARIAEGITDAREQQSLAVTRGIQPDDPREPSLRMARRTLAKAEAERQIVALHSGWGYVESGSYADKVQRLLALPYADHPDYREEWKP